VCRTDVLLHGGDRRSTARRRPWWWRARRRRARRRRRPLDLAFGSCGWRLVPHQRRQQPKSNRLEHIGSSRATTRPSAQPSTQPPTRPSAEPRPSTRPSTGETRPGQRPGEGTRPDDRPDRADGSRREDWQNYGNAAREDWQDFYEEGGGGYYYGGYYGYPYGYPHTTVVITSLEFSSMQSETQCTLSEVSVNGVRYYKCGSTWYNRVIDGTNVNYVTVSAPPGY
jgi:hypothetical protein